MSVGYIMKQHIFLKKNKVSHYCIDCKLKLDDTLSDQYYCKQFPKMKHYIYKVKSFFTCEEVRIDRLCQFYKAIK